MSINQLIRITGSSFRVLDAAMNATAQNVANMETGGYTRRRVTLQSDSLNVQGLYTPPLRRRATGAGVSVQGYERMRDVLLQKSAWEARAGLGGFSEQHRVMSSIEGILGGSGTASLSRVLEDFFDGWSTLADNPTDAGVRLQLRSLADTAASTLNRLDAGLAAFAGEVRQELTTAVDSVNSLLAEVADLNNRIDRARSQGAPDLSAEDRRDQVVDELASLVPVSVQTDRREAFTITIEGLAVVQGSVHVPLTIQGASTRPEVHLGETGITLARSGPESGRVGALIETLHQTVPSVRGALLDLARNVAEDINALHESGHGLDGSTGVSFFDFAEGAGGEGYHLSVSEAVRADARSIAASSGDPIEGFADSDVARAIAGLRAGNGTTGSSPPSEIFVDLVSGIGSQAKRASSEGAARSGVVDHLIALERGVSGVSLEEEMTNLVRFQQAYAASARVLNAAQDMMDTLLRM